MKQRIVKLYRDNRLRLRITLLTVSAFILVSTPISMYMLFASIIERGNSRYEEMVYRTMQIENEVRRAEYVRNIDPSFYAAISDRDEKITVENRTNGRIEDYEDHRKIKNPPNEYEKKIAVRAIKFLACQYNDELYRRSLTTFTDESTGYQYATYTHAFHHNDQFVIVEVTRNMTTIITKPISNFLNSAVTWLIWYAIVGTAVGYISVSIVFRPLKRALEKGFKEIISSNYKSRFTVSGKYGREITDVKYKINDILDRMEEIVEKNIESIQDVSHEVNTHLTSIKQSVDVMRLYGTNNQQILNDRLDSIDVNIKRMTNIMSTILDLARLNQGSFNSKVETHSVRGLIETFINHKRKVYPEFIFIIQYDTEEPNITIDKEHFFLALNPIIENAVRYSKNTRCILIRVMDNDCPNNLRIDVKNRGEYIQPEEIPHLFDRHYRGKNASCTQGSGLGLTISKRVMDLYDGKIEVVSKPIGLTTFTLVFPKKIVSINGPST